jgi:hypothetical protein
VAQAETGQASEQERRQPHQRPRCLARVVVGHVNEGAVHEQGGHPDAHGGPAGVVVHRRQHQRTRRHVGRHQLPAVPVTEQVALGKRRSGRQQTAQQHGHAAPAHHVWNRSIDDGLGLNV